MYELKVSVKKVMGKCTAEPAMKTGDYFTVSDGDLQIPEGGYICLWALQSLMPLLTPKEREIAEEKEKDWMWRVHHAQCPDPNGRVVFKIERTGKLNRAASTKKVNSASSKSKPDSAKAPKNAKGVTEGGLKSLEIEVESYKGKCSSRMQVGDKCTLRSGRLYIPAGRHFCLYALQAAVPLLPAKQRALQDGDWMKEDNRVLCPDPAGNVILKIDQLREE